MKHTNINALVRKALPIIRARLYWKTIGGITKTTTKNDNSPVAINTKSITIRAHFVWRELINMSHKEK